MDDGGGVKSESFLGKWIALGLILIVVTTIIVIKLIRTFNG